MCYRNSERTTSGLGIALALLSLFVSRAPLLAASSDAAIAGAHPLYSLDVDGQLSILNTETYQVVATMPMVSQAAGMGSPRTAPSSWWPIRRSVLNKSPAASTPTATPFSGRAA
jgi:hypothetical protein